MPNVDCRLPIEGLRIEGCRLLGLAIGDCRLGIADWEWPIALIEDWATISDQRIANP
jgi:hypothetical protein